MAGGVAETSYYPALSNLSNTVGKTLKPKVRGVMNLCNLRKLLGDGTCATSTSTNGLLAERARQRLGILHRRLSGRQEVAELPRGRSCLGRA